MIRPEMRTVRMISTWLAIRIASVRMYLHISRSITIRPKSGSLSTSREMASLSSRSPMNFLSSIQPPTAHERNQPPGVGEERAHRQQELHRRRHRTPHVDENLGEPRHENTVNSTTVTMIVTERIASG
jgi:hypothetical protein